MTIGGWINLTLSVGSVITLFAWCLLRVFREPQSKLERLTQLEPIDEVKIEER